MDIVIEQATLLYPDHKYHGQKVTIRVVDGKIVSIDQKKINTPDKITGKNLFVSPGWVDIGAQSGEPGYEHRETLNTLSKAAAFGGYTTLAIFPNTKPALHSKSEIEFIKQKSRPLQTEIIPIGAISKNCQGKELAEMIDMHQTGAIAYSDGKHPVYDPGVIMRAMIYAKHFEGLIINHPNDENISGPGLMHEGAVSQSLGLKGIPSMAETIMLQRDLRLAQYSDCRYLAHLLSADESVSLIKQAKKSNDKIFSSVSYLNLVHTDDVLEQFDSIYKQSPPLRTEKDRKELIKGIQDGVLDIICSNHTPLEVEKKDLEFAYADAGTLGLQICFAALNTKNIISPEAWAYKAAFKTRQILNLTVPTMVKGSNADLTIFDTEHEWVYDQKDILSPTINSPFMGSSFKGKVLATISKNKAWLATN
ncbi:MAG: amidohydrolase family protein [Saprospiraceae bacterium]|nr:amidohydrolase family protein [Saprospiraceae bacterium]